MTDSLLGLKCLFSSKKFRDAEAKIVGKANAHEWECELYVYPTLHIYPYLYLFLIDQMGYVSWRLLGQSNLQSDGTPK